ncbi:MAG TPA: DUF4174 domain-containing protein [Flavisolibacter sp.]|nr:DUF4174 domain-containing protein [Flavisolibacter sp.]
MTQNSAKRQVLIFGPPDSQQLMAQLALLSKESAGLKERDVAVSAVTKNSSLYRQFGIATTVPFVILLVGKDGGEKYRSKELTTAQQLFDLIDAMPMRMQEIRRDKKQPNKKGST